MAVNHISFSRVFLPIAVLLSAINGKAAQAAVASPFCTRAQPGNQQNFCNAAVNGARTWEAALTNIMNAAKRDVAPVAPLISNLGKTLTNSPQKGSRLETCNDSLTDFNDCITEILDNITGGDLVAIEDATQRIYTTLSTCLDALEGEAGVDLSQIQKYEKIAGEYANISMAVLCSQDKMYCEPEI